MGYLCGMERDYILLGDCYDILAQLPDASIDAVITDPPYGITCCKWDTAPDLPRLFAGLWRVLKPNGAIVMFAQQPFATDCINASRREFKYEVVWEKSMKQGFLNAKKRPLKSHENIMVFYRKQPTYNPQFHYGKPNMIRNHGNNRNRVTVTGGVSGTKSLTWEYIDTGRRYPTDIVKFSNWNHGGAIKPKGFVAPNIHPTQKPLPLLEYLVKTYTDEGDTVLDPFMGSGTTAVAALRTGRHFIGSEMLEEYHAKSLARIDAARAGLARERG